jgi:hypothetical protein
VRAALVELEDEDYLYARVSCTTTVAWRVLCVFDLCE